MSVTTSTDAVLHTFDEPGDTTRRPADPNSPASLRNEAYLRDMADNDPDPKMREWAREGLKNLEEKRRRLESSNGDGRDSSTQD